MVEECVFSHMPVHGCFPLISAAAGGLARLLCGNSRGRCRSAARENLSVEIPHLAGLTRATNSVLVGLVLVGMGPSRGAGNQQFFARPQACICIINDPVALTVDFSALGPPPHGLRERRHLFAQLMPTQHMPNQLERMSESVLSCGLFRHSSSDGAAPYKPGTHICHSNNAAHMHLQSLAV